MRIILRTGLVLVALVGAAACSDDGGDKSSGRVQVVAGLYPLADAARRVAGDRASVTNLTPAGAEPHDFEPTPSHVERVNDADLVLYLGDRFQPAVADLAEGRGDKAVDVLEGIELLGDDDPHVWLDPERMQQIATTIEQALTRVDPEGRSEYAANAARYRDRLGELASELDAGLASCERNILIVPHASFEYFGDRHQLEQEPITGMSPEAEPDPARLARLAELVRDGGITTIFVDPIEPAEAAETLARETKTKTAELRTIESLTKQEADKGEDYFSLMRRNLATVREALSCP